MVVVLCLGAAACGKDDKGDTSSAKTTSTSTSTAQSTTAPTTAAEPAAAHELAITATEPKPGTYAFDMGGAASVPAGLVTVTLDNQGTLEHQATIVKLKDTDYDAFATAVMQQGAAGLAGAAEIEGGPNAVAGGAKGSATMVLDAGTYAVVCFIPGPPDGKSHAEHGMITKLEVSGSAGTAAVEAGDATIALKDFAFGLPADFASGGTFKITNQGKQPHEMAVYELAAGKTLKDAEAFFSSEGPPTGPPPVTGVGGISAMNPGKSNSIDLHLDPGNYIVMCFLPDVAGDFKPHFTHGMVAEVTVP